MKEEFSRRNFLEKLKRIPNLQNLEPRATEVEKVVLRKTVMPVKILEDGLTGSENFKTGGGEKQNFKEKLSKFKFLEAGGQTECKKESGTPVVHKFSKFTKYTSPKEEKNLQTKVKPSLSQDQIKDQKRDRLVLTNRKTDSGLVLDKK